MAPESKKPVETAYAGVKKAKKNNANKHTEGQLNSVEHALATTPSGPDTKEMLIFSKINFSPLIDKSLLALAMMATSASNNMSSNPTPPNPASYFAILPTELLILIIRQLPVTDRVRVAIAYPEFFMSERLNIFVMDAYKQIRTPMYVTDPADPEWIRGSLVCEAIQEGTFSVDAIARILDFYELVCVEQQIHPHAFINATFGSPPNRPLAPGEFMRVIQLPLHMAVQSGRLDMVRLLIQRGADASRQYIPIGDRPLNAFQYALELALRLVFAGEISSQRPNAERIDELEAVALELSYSSPNPAYMVDTFIRSPELGQSISLGLERVVLSLMKQFETSPKFANIDRKNPTYIAQRNIDLSRVLLGTHEMPQVIRYMLDHGATSRSPFESATNIAARLANAEAALLWEMDNQHESLPASIHRIVNLASHDRNLYERVEYLVGVFIRRGNVYAQRRVLWNTVIAGQDAYTTRSWLLENVNPEVLDGGLLRMAIRHRDRTTAMIVLNSMRNRGQSIDEELPRLAHPSDAGGVDVLSYWASTPLTYALAQENYYEAANLLSFGADPNMVPPNIRNRVCLIRDRLNAGIIDPVTLVFRNTHLGDGSVPTRAEAERALNYCFSRLIDDPNCPVPNYVRHHRNPDLPLDHPDNDSVREDPPEQDSEVTSHFLLGQTYIP
ncbi:hypothetical protein F4859DRAFT_529171 [Xylaria cf. heliscus]|nr:hypothetical protein F4859DRAFT_529171 [Xylaria cf. heliscus]